MIKRVVRVEERAHTTALRLTTTVISAVQIMNGWTVKRKLN